MWVDGTYVIPSLALARGGLLPRLVSFLFRWCVTKSSTSLLGSDAGRHTEKPEHLLLEAKIEVFTELRHGGGDL